MTHRSSWGPAVDSAEETGNETISETARCEACGRTIIGALTPTGHIDGARYRSRSHGMTYQVDGTATLWELAPDAATRRRWQNGNVTVSQSPRDTDALLCPGCLPSAPSPTRRSARSRSSRAGSLRMAREFGEPA